MKMWNFVRRSVSAIQPHRHRRLSNRTIQFRSTPIISSTGPQIGCGCINGQLNESYRHFSSQYSIKKGSQLNKRGSDHKAAASTEISNDEEDDLISDEYTPSNSIDPLNNNNDDMNNDRYKEWHNLKREQLQNLSNATEEILTAISLSNNDIPPILQLMTQWKDYNAQITPEMHSLSPFRAKNPQYPPSEFLTSQTFEAAAKCQSLLTHLLAGNRVSPVDQVTAYKLGMETWSYVHHPTCGDRAEDLLQAYGERFGGDMDLSPDLECYKIVLRGHVRSCSSYFVQDVVEGGSSNNNTPGEKAWEILNLLSSVSAWDLYLKPDLELYSLVLAAMRHSLLDWKGRVQTFGWERKRYDGLAIKALHVFKEMDSLFAEQKRKRDEFSLEEWHCLLCAYADMIAIVSRVRLQGGEMLQLTADELLQSLEILVLDNAEQIVRAAAMDGNSFLLKDVQRSIEEAYVNAISSRVNTNSRGHFDNLTSALKDVDRSEKIFQRMKDRYQPTSPFLFPAPTQELYSALIDCVCECLHNDYSTSDIVMSRLDEFPHNKASRLLKELEELQAISSDGQPIDGSIYRKVIWAYCQTVFWKSILQEEKFFDIADSIQDMLKDVQDRYNRGLVSFPSLGNATKMYNSAFRFYSKRSKNKAGGMSKRLASRTLRLLEQLEQWHETSDGKIRPDEVTFSLIIKILADNGAFDAAESMFTRMEAFGMKPNEKHYHAAMRALSRGGPRSADDNSPLKAESILQRVKEKYAEDGSAKPTTTLYTSCISAFGGSSEYNSVKKVLELSKELTDLYATTNDKAFKPDAMFYSAILDALSKTKDDTALPHSLRILDELETKTKHSEGVNRFAYTNVLHAIAKSSVSDSVKMAEDLIRRMIKRSNDLNDPSILPDNVAYTALIQVLANSRQKDSVDRAMTWFKKMEDQYLAGDESAEPNKMTYTALINCWAKSNRIDAPQKVSEILARMEEAYENGHFDSKPDVFVYGSIIKVLSRSKSDDKATRIWQLYEQMKTKYESGDIEMQPNNITVTSIISACGYSNPNRVARANALKVLIECISEIKNQKYITPSPVTFRTLLDAIKHIVPEDETRRPLSSSVFQLCCRHGQLDTSVLEALQRVQPELYEKLPLGVQTRAIEEIPLEWTRNVRKHS